MGWRASQDARGRWRRPRGPRAITAARPRRPRHRARGGARARAAPGRLRRRSDQERVGDQVRRRRRSRGPDARSRGPRGARRLSLGERRRKQAADRRRRLLQPRLGIRRRQLVGRHHRPLAAVALGDRRLRPRSRERRVGLRTAVRHQQAREGASNLEVARRRQPERQHRHHKQRPQPACPASLHDQTRLSGNGQLVKPQNLRPPTFAPRVSAARRVCGRNPGRGAASHQRLRFFVEPACCRLARRR